MLTPQKTLGLLWMIWSALTTAVGIGVGAMFGGMGAMATVLPDTHTREPAPEWVGWLFGGFGLVLGGLFAAIGILGFVAGMGVRKGRLWALVTVVLLAILQLSSFPLGTGLAIYTFVVAFPVLAARKGVPRQGEAPPGG